MNRLVGCFCSFIEQEIELAKKRMKTHLCFLTLLHQLLITSKNNLQKMKNLLVLLILSFSVSQLTAQFNVTHIPRAKVETIHSDIVGEDYILHITTPFGFQPSDKKIPVFFYLDAWSNSGTMNELAAGLLWNKQLDPVIFVGISYNTNPFEFGKLRKRDFMPPINEKDIANGGDKFLQFIKKELIPYMENNYGTSSKDRGIIGSSLGGLFVTWVLKEEPTLFNRLGIVSPSLWYGKEFLFSDKELLNNIKNAKDLKVFLAAGSLESENMISNTNKLFDLVQANKNIESQKVIFESESHGSVGLPAIARGVRYLYRSKFKNYKDASFVHYKRKEYKKGIKNLQLAFEAAPEEVDVDDKYDMACFYSLLDDTENAFRYLDMVVEMKYKNYEYMEKDKDFVKLYSDDRWVKIINAVKKNDELAKKN